eukprot:5726066-Pyramimonas_sp.AAC.1
MWDGHANVSVAGPVNVFEYLYKYQFKGPGKVNFDATLDPSAGVRLPTGSAGDASARRSARGASSGTKPMSGRLLSFACPFVPSMARWP